ncbi:hypothetical protein BDQ17DRAFT_989682 [Cyathus striatus]|nr:hypothetical protein BDQ17DRAFT_989682 [Cyathus striatus]
MTIAEAPMLLTHICSSWRNIAHSAPRLWSAIHIVLPNFCTGRNPPESFILFQEDFLSLKMEQRKAAAKEWLDRSAARPLSISVYQKSGFSPRDDRWTIHQQHLSFITETIVPYHERWYSLDMYLHLYVLDGLLQIGLTAENLKMLKKLHISCLSNSASHDWEPGSKWTLDITSFLPSHASSLTLHGVGIKPSYFSSVPRHIVGQLTELNLELLPPWNHPRIIDLADFVSNALCYCPALRVLKLELKYHPGVIGNTSWSRSAVDTVTLHHLEMLSITTPQRLILWIS